MNMTCTIELFKNSVTDDIFYSFFRRLSYFRPHSLILKKSLSLFLWLHFSRKIAAFCDACIYMDRNIGSSTFSAPSCAVQQRQINATLHTIESWYDNKIHKKTHFASSASQKPPPPKNALTTYKMQQQQQQ